MAHATFSLQAVSKEFHYEGTLLRIFENLNETFHPVNSYALAGTSGSGKSTLLHILAGIEKPTSGTVYFQEKNLATLSQKERELFFKHDIGLVFQLPYLINELTVLENLMIKGAILSMSKQESEGRAYELLTQLGIAQKAHALPQRLSGGQQHRVALARALFAKPTFLFADEPTGNLDEQTGKAIIDIVKEYHQEYGMGVIISSHDAYVLQQMDTVLFLQDGLLVHEREGTEYGKRRNLQTPAISR